MNFYSNLLLSHHPLLHPSAKSLKGFRPLVKLWADASGQGYGGHLGSADLPIALYQHQRTQSIDILSTTGLNTISLSSDIAMHEAAALYLSLDHWKALLRGTAVQAHTDNSIVSLAFGSKVSKGPKDCLTIVDAIKELAETEDIQLDVNWVVGKNNRLADVLSRPTRVGDPQYPPEVSRY